MRDSGEVQTGDNQERESRESEVTFQNVFRYQTVLGEGVE